MRNSNDSLVSATATLRKPRPIGLAQYSCLNQQPRSIMFLSQATVPANPNEVSKVRLVNRKMLGTH